MKAARVRDLLDAQFRLAHQFAGVSQTKLGQETHARRAILPAKKTPQMGGEAAMVASMEQPELLERFMEIEHQTNLAMAETLIGMGVDIIIRDGFYETCEFWSPRQIETLVLPRVNAEAVRVRQLGGI